MVGSAGLVVRALGLWALREGILGLGLGGVGLARSCGSAVWVGKPWVGQDGITQGCI